MRALHAEAARSQLAVRAEGASPNLPGGCLDGVQVGGEFCEVKRTLPVHHVGPSVVYKQAGVQAAAAGGACRARPEKGTLRRFTFNINNLCLQSAGFVVFTKCRIIFRKCFLKKITRHLEKTTRHLVGPEIKEKMPSRGIKTRRKSPRRRLSPFLLCKGTTFFREKQIANFHFNISRSHAQGRKSRAAQPRVRIN